MIALTCTACGSRIRRQWLEAVPATGERVSARACSVACCEALGTLDGLVVGWRFTAPRVAA